MWEIDERLLCNERRSILCDIQRDTKMQMQQLIFEIKDLLKNLIKEENKENVKYE